MINPRSTFRDERLDKLAGTRGSAGDRAVRLSDLETAVIPLVQAIIGSTLFTRSAALAADVGLSASGVWVDGPSVALTPGLWVIFAQMQHANAAAVGPGQVAARIWDGATAYAAGEETNGGATGAALQISLSAVIACTVNKVITLQALTTAGSANSKMMATAPTAGATPVATRIVAMRIGELTNG